MPGTSIVDEIELIIEDIGGGGGKHPPRGGDDGDEGGKRRGPQMPSSRRYTTAIVIGIVSIIMFFMAMASAYLYLRAKSGWVPLHLPWIIWMNTAILLLSSGAMELARRRLALADVAQFRRLWSVATSLGVLFLVGQLAAWRQFVLAGFYVSTNQGSSFFYIFTGLHGLHLVGGICALLYVAMRKFEKAKLSRAVAAEVVSYYWHFMDGLWIFLLALLYLGK
jgi:cytochrome c oxidase subunit III